MTTTAHEDQYAPEPVSGDPVFPSRATLIAWVEEELRAARGIDAVAFLATLDRIRRITLAHLHLRDTKADSDGGGA
jgi:hypothetical protein